MRARIVLACADGGSIVAVAARLRLDRKTVARWRSRFLARRLDGLSDEPRPGVPRSITDAQVEEVVVRTLEEVPAGSTHWFKRELAHRVYDTWSDNPEVSVLGTCLAVIELESGVRLDKEMSRGPRTYVPMPT
ncbi:helix-turn-helix domain-containing protein [Nonomuraea glycinis]|uniref:helix-turn-helix domain-containing protein n=1 Tax=Nonomuraea glycinis TaxID=2047744 RepID=UPI002E0DC367|nr:helix-turn-helix domain-containing protein [Nonomuraea glycinis]